MASLSSEVWLALALVVVRQRGAEATVLAGVDEAKLLTLASRSKEGVIAGAGAVEGVAGPVPRAVVEAGHQRPAAVLRVLVSWGAGVTGRTGVVGLASTSSRLKVAASKHAGGGAVQDQIALWEVRVSRQTRIAAGGRKPGVAGAGARGIIAVSLSRARVWTEGWTRARWVGVGLHHTLTTV